MKIQGSIALLLALVPGTIAFYPYTPTWMCNDGDCLVSDGETEVIIRDVASEVSQGISTLRIKKFSKKSQTVSNKRGIIFSSTPTQSNSAAIDQDGIDYSYFAEVFFGSNLVPLYMLLDSGATNTWVPTTDCESLSCLNPTHKTYGSINSTTYKTTNTPFTIRYGTGDVGGYYASDTVSIAGLTVELTFGAANETSDDFNNFPFYGILGLGYATTAGDNVTTFMGTVGGEKLLKSNVYGIDLSRAHDGDNDGEVNFGAPDTSKYNGSLVYTSVISGSSTWSIAVDDAGFGGKTAGLTGRSVLIDTGTTWAFMPPADAAQLYAIVEGSSLNSAGDTYSVPCNTTTPLQLVFSGVSFDISSEDWVGGVTDSSNDLCACNIYPQNTLGNGQWLIGDTFLKNVYTVFDYDESRVGFGAKTGSAVLSGSSSTATAGASGTSIPHASGSGLLPAASQTSTSSSSSHTSTSSSKASASNGISSSAASIPQLNLKPIFTIALFFSLGLFLI